MFKLSSSFRLSFTAGAVVLAISPALSAQEAGAVPERISVTGSHIKRSQVEDATPVQVLTAEDISASGKITLTDLLRDLAINTGRSFDEQATSSFSAGSAAVGLRGLGPKNTLVLVNGQRVSYYGFAQGTQDNFVDLNALPLSAVKRVEILKDGASAAYGSDAIAGVVNILLHDNYNQTQVRAAGGATTEGGFGQHSAGVTTGFGDLYKDGFNITLSYDFFDRSELTADERDFTRSGDFRHLPGGRLAGWSSQGGNYLTNPTRPQAFEQCPAGSELRPRSDFTPGAVGEVCAFNGQPDNTLQPAVQRHQFFAYGTAQISPDLQGYAELIYANNKSSHIFGPALTVGAGLRAYEQSTGSLVEIPVALPVGHPDNPTDQAVPFEYTFFDIGPRYKSNKQVFHRVLAGLKYRGADWDWELHALNSQSKQREYVQNFVNRYVFEQVLADGSYDFFNGNNSADVIEALRLNTRRPGTFELSSINFNASTILAQLPHGDLGIAFGADWRREKMDAWTSPEVLSGTELRPAINLIRGERDVVAAFVEADIPVLADLSINAAVRGDDYNDFGSAISPKVSVHYALGDSWLLRGSWSKGFRAPSLPEIAESNTISYGTVIDAFDPVEPGARRGFTQVRAGNPDLDAEKSINTNAGIIWSPTNDFSISFDFFRIKQDNIIGSDNNLFIVNNPDIYGDRIQRDAAGRLQIITNQYRNQGTRTTSGYDIAADYSIALAGSTVKLHTSWSRLLRYEQALIAGETPVDGAGNNQFGSLPAWKGLTQASWILPEWRWSLAAQYTHSYAQRVATASSNPGLAARVDHYWQLNTAVAYTGFENTDISLSVQNLTDATPPFDPSAGSYGYDSSQFNLRGRFVTLAVSYIF